MDPARGLVGSDNRVAPSGRTFALAVSLLTLVLFLAFGTSVFGEMHNLLAKRSSPDSRSTQAKIAQAMSAGPPEIAKAARIAEVDASGKLVVLREGDNGFTCMPAAGDTTPALCADATSMQWFADFTERKPSPTTTVPGITYMLAGATQRSDSDPYDTTSPLIKIGRHWMIMWPFDPATTGLPKTHRSTGAYIMWAETPYAHLHIMGSPYGSTMAPKH